MKINMALLVAIAAKAREAELVEGPRLALYAYEPEITRAPAAPKSYRGVWQCYGPEEEEEEEGCEAPGFDEPPIPEWSGFDSPELDYNEGE